MMALRYIDFLLLCSIFLINIRYVKLHCTEAGNDKCQIVVDQKVHRTCNGESVVFNISVKSPAGGSTWKPEPPRKPVPVGYVHLAGHGYYKYHTALQEWNAARITCQSEGGHLAVLNSEAEAKFIAKIPTASYHWAFIGMHDYFKEGQWITIFDQPLEAAGFSKFHAGEPTRLFADENCGTIFPDGLLGDHLCHEANTFFCEINEKY